MQPTMWSKTSLVVYDEAPFRPLLKQGLEGAGYAVLTASNGEEAIEILAQQEVGAMLLDLRMPGLSGDQVLPHVKKEHPDISVLMVTSHGDMETVIRIMKEGAYDYITKSFQFDDLIFREEKALERRALVMQSHHHLPDVIHQCGNPPLETIFHSYPRRCSIRHGWRCEEWDMPTQRNHCYGCSVGR